MSTEEEVQDENTIKEEYKLWRENCRYMYEFVSETALKWPSITVQWLPQHTTKEADGLIEAGMLLGTHTSGEDTNYLKLASTQLPIVKDETNKINSRIKIARKFENQYEINRARFKPQDPNVVGTINGGGQVDIYKLDDEGRKPVHHLTHHGENGYGISWNKFQLGLLATGADDKTVYVHKVDETVEQVLKINQHEDIVNDVKWHSFDENLLASVSDDKYMNLYDIRTGSKPILRYYGKESQGINSLSFSPFSSSLLAMGNANSNISLVDLRQMNASGTGGILHTMMGHSDAITSLEFSPHQDGIVASGSQDRRVMIWDLSKIGEEQVQEDAEDGCPELFMMHAGHTGGVTDLNWCPYKDWTLSSVADDNIVHVWEVSKGLLNAETGEVDESELE